MILGHHGGELPLLQAALASAAAVPLLLVPLRAELARLVGRLRRRQAGD
ncbi:MAG TPA: hypothetical protein VD704_09790 [Gaiellaceae bacterium]|nr:hypothetical protein [Gaiellaceae bacterium]